MQSAIDIYYMRCFVIPLVVTWQLKHRHHGFDQDFCPQFLILLAGCVIEFRKDLHQDHGFVPDHSIWITLGLPSLTNIQMIKRLFEVVFDSSRPL